MAGYYNSGNWMMSGKKTETGMSSQAWTGAAAQLQEYNSLLGSGSGSGYPGVGLGGQYSASQIETKYQVTGEDKNQEQQQQQQQQYLGQLAAAASGSMMCRPVH